MTEQGPPTRLDEPEADLSSASVDPGRETTGVASVDQVLADVDRLDDLPLEEHLGAFERAHEGLRAALDASPDPEKDESAAAPSEHPDDPA